MGLAMEQSNLGSFISRFKWYVALILVPLVAYGSIATFDQIKGTKLNIDNIQVDANTISTTNTNGDLILSPNGSGVLLLDNLQLGGNTITSTDTDGNVNITTNGNGNFTFENFSVNTNTISSTNSNGDFNLDLNGTGRLLLTDLTASRVPYLDAAKRMQSSAVTDTELGYLSGVTSAVQTQLDAKVAKSTLTAKGDIYVATGSGVIVRQAIGSDGTFLKADSGQTNGISWSSSANSAVSVRSTTGNDSILTSDDVVIWSGADAAPVLYTAGSGNTGKIVTIIHNGSLGQEYTINNAGSETIGGVTTDTYALATPGEVLKIISDGTNWKILEHRTATDKATFANCGGSTFITNATCTSWWQREGRYARIDARIGFSGATDAATTAYVQLPAGLSVDTNYLTRNTSISDPLGECAFWDSSASRFMPGQSLFLNSSTIRCAVLSESAAASHDINDVTTTYPATIAINDEIMWSFKIPISGWQP